MKKFINDCKSLWEMGMKKFIGFINVYEGLLEMGVKKFLGFIKRFKLYGYKNVGNVLKLVW